MTAAARLRAQRLALAAAFGWTGFALLAFLRFAVFAAGFEVPIETSNVSGRVLVASPSAEGERAGVRQGHELLGIDGVPLAAWNRSDRREELRLENNRYELARPDGSRYEVELAAQPNAPNAVGLAWLLVGASYLAIGALVWLLRPGREESWAFALFCALMGAAFFTGVDTNRQPFGELRSIVSMFLLGAVTFQLFTTYPFEPAWIVRRRWLRLLPWGIAALALLVATGLELAGAFSPIIFPVGLLFVGAALLVCGGILVAERRRRRAEENVARADVMLLGALVGFLPVMALFGIEIFLPTGEPVYLGALWLVVFPIAMAYGIVKRELFDIRHLMRSSVAYGAATLAITGLYAALLAGADAALVRFHMDARSPSFTMLFLFVAILAVNPLRNRVQAVVDRLFDRERGRDRQTVREVSEAMVSMLSIQEIVERIVRALSDAMGVERSMVLLLSEDERLLRAEAWGGSFGFDPKGFALSTEHPVCKYLWMRRQELSRADLAEETDPAMRAACQELFERLDVALLVPVLFGVDLLGVIAVGRKLSGERMSADDRQLLLTLANQSSIAIENAKAFDEIAKLNETLEARVEERTHELRDTQAQLMQSEKMRTLGQLVAGVAHELNNPIGFVHANLKLLEEYTAKLARQQELGEDTGKSREAIQKLIARSREGTERVTKIVADLRAFSRMDQGELAEADLNDEIERTLTLMEPRCKNCIEIARDFGTLPAVRCHAGQLNQVFLNLLMNACDAIGASGRISVRTRAENGLVRLEFEDSGPGIPHELRDRVFEPFFTTKPVGQGTGLGLSLTHGIIERHGGRIWVDAERQTGTRFVIELPIEGAPQLGAGTS